MALTGLLPPLYCLHAPEFPSLLLDSSMHSELLPAAEYMAWPIINLPFNSISLHCVFMKETELEMPAIPHLFRCPISLELFTDPVTLSTGQTYDRRNIERWIQLGNLTCPVTMQTLQEPFFVPNNTLRHLIDQWLTQQHGVDPDFLQRIDPDRSLLDLKQCLESSNDASEKVKTIDKVRVLLEQSPSRSPCLLRLGFLSMLLESIFQEVEYFDRERGKFFEVALWCVVKLVQASNEMESSTALNILKQQSKMASFLALFERGTPTITTSLCRLLEAISSSPGTKELCTIFGQKRRFLRTLNLLLHRHGEVSEAGIKAIWSLSSMEPTRQNLVHEEVVDALIAHIKNNCETGSAPLAMATLERFIGLEKAKEALIVNHDGIRCIVKMVFRVSDLEGSESALNLLTALCPGSLRAREEAIGSGVLTQLLFLLQSQGSGRTKTKARMLLKLLRSKE